MEIKKTEPACTECLLGDSLEAHRLGWSQSYGTTWRIVGQTNDHGQSDYSCTVNGSPGIASVHTRPPRQARHRKQQATNTHQQAADRQWTTKQRATETHQARTGQETDRQDPIGKHRTNRQQDPAPTERKHSARGSLRSALQTPPRVWSGFVDSGHRTSKPNGVPVWTVHSASGPAGKVTVYNFGRSTMAPYTWKEGPKEDVGCLATYQRGSLQLADQG